MDDDKKKNLALMKYGAIAPIINELPEEYSSYSEYFDRVSAKGIIDWNGSVRYYAANTIEGWYRKYIRYGFDSLISKGRSDLGKPRKMDEDTMEKVRYLKDHYKRMGATAIYNQLLNDGDISKSDFSQSTLSRYLKRYAAEKKAAPDQVEMHRYEREHVNEVWCGDSSQIFYITDRTDGKKHRVFAIALIDDASRFILGIMLFYNDNFNNLLVVIRSAVAKYGRPVIFNFDNGSTYRNKQMELLAGRIGSVTHYDDPYTPTQKAKIERFFRTLKDQWSGTLDPRDFGSLSELQDSLDEYIEKYNSRLHSSLNGKSPRDRFFEEPERIKRLPAEVLNKAFLLEESRRVSNDCVLPINQALYETPQVYAKQRVKIRYTPDMKEVYIEDGDDLVEITLLDKHSNSHIKREKIRLSGNS